MALKPSYRGQRYKRSGDDFTTPSKSTENYASSSDSNFQMFPSENKVRRTISSKKLLKDSECFTVDSDHIYTITRSSGSVGDTVLKGKNSEKEEKDIMEKPARKGCFSKNALLARKNRERKKLYVSSLESENKLFLKENMEIKQKLADQNLKINNMKLEILYLKGLLANSKELGQILRNLKEISGLPVTSSILQSGVQHENTEKGEGPDDYFSCQSRIKPLTCGYNFSVLNRDISLNSCWNTSDVTDFENCPFNTEKDFHDNGSVFHFNTETLSSEDSCNFEEVLKDSEVGICLHVNQKQVSVEVCSICNRRATKSLSKSPDDIL